MIRYLCLVCRMCVSRFLACRIQVIVIPSRDSNQGLQVSVYLNLTHTLNHSATTAGCHSTLMLQLFCVLAFFVFFKFPIQNLVKTCIQIPTLNQKTDNKENSRNLFRELARFLESVAFFFFCFFLLFLSLLFLKRLAPIGALFSQMSRTYNLYQ